MELLTHIQAWDIFYAEFRASEDWCKLSNAQKNVLITADRDRREKRIENGKALPLGYNRAKRIIEQYAPGRFEWVHGAIDTAKPS